MEKIKTCKPEGLKGKARFIRMRKVHEPLFNWARPLLEIKNDDDILDVGCGEGANLEYFKSKTHGVVAGLDISELAIKLSKKKLGNSVDLYYSDIQTFGYLSESFDVISAFCTIKFWPDLKICFANIYRLLKSDGTFFIADHGQYDKDQVLALLKEVGFNQVDIKSKDDWTAIIAIKGKR